MSAPYGRGMPSGPEQPDDPPTAGQLRFIGYTRDPRREASTESPTWHYSPRCALAGPVAQAHDLTLDHAGAVRWCQRCGRHMPAAANTQALLKYWATAPTGDRADRLVGYRYWGDAEGWAKNEWEWLATLWPNRRRSLEPPALTHSLVAVVPYRASYTISRLAYEFGGSLAGQQVAYGGRVPRPATDSVLDVVADLWMPAREAEGPLAYLPEVLRTAAALTL